MISWYQKNAYWIKWIISISLLIVIFIKIDIDYFYKAFTIVGWQYYVFLIIISLVLQLISALKWQFFLPDHSFVELFKLCLISFFYSFLLPSSLTGDATRAIKTDKKDKGNTVVFTSIFFDRWLGLYSIIIIMLVSFLFISLKSLMIFVYPVIGLAILMILLTYLFYSSKLTNAISKSVIYFSISSKVILKFISKIQELLISIEVGSKNFKSLILNLLFSIIYQFGSAFGGFVLVKILSIDLNFWDFCLIISIIQLLLLLPMSIAGVGLKDISTIVILGSAGISSEKSLALSLVGYPVTLLFVLVGFYLDRTSSPIIDRKTI